MLQNELILGSRVQDYQQEQRAKAQQERLFQATLRQLRQRRAR